MIPEVYTQLVEDAHKALQRHHLHDALYLINIILRDLQYSKALDDCQQLSDNYARMLQFIASGGQDENSESLHIQMLAEAQHLLFSAQRQHRLKSEDCPYTQAFRQLQERDENLASLSTAFLEADVCTTEREALLDDLFNAIWTSANLGEHDIAILQELFSQTTNTELCTLLSAIGLSLQEYPDEAKLLWLMEFTCHQTLEVRLRALCGIIFAALVHAQDMLLYQETTTRLIQAFSENHEIQQLIAQLNYDYLICLQTETAREKFENDILPNFMKVAKNGRVELGFTEEGELDFDTPTDDIGEKQKAKNSLLKLFDMHRDGVDLNARTMLGTRRLPFFDRLPHWFLPFDKRRTEILNITDKRQDSDMMKYLTSFMGQSECAPDRYSTLFIMDKYIGKDTLSNLSQAILKDEDGNERPKIDISELDRQLSQDIPTVSRMYMRQLYRIFMMSPISKEWSQLFQLSSNWLLNPILSPAIADNRQALLHLANYLSKYGNYQEAEAYFNRLVQLEGCDAETLRKAGYCKQKQGQFAAALTHYIQADVLEPENRWTLSQMQFCYAHLERNEQRLDCLLQLEKLVPDDDKVITETGLCLMELHRWQDASQRFFRLELEGKRIVPSQRAIAWCALNQGKWEQAMKYYRKLIDTPSARWQDYLHAGHTAWLSDHISEAVTLYRSYIKHYLTDDPKITDALTPFNDDTPLLLSLGKKQHEINLMHDILAPLSPEGE